MLDKKSYDLSLNNEEYELKMNLGESFIEFKVEHKNVISNFYYKEEFDLSTINENKYLIKSFKELKEPYEFFVRLCNDKRVQLIKSKEDTITVTPLA